jgi:hypothetical protein
MPAARGSGREPGRTEPGGGGAQAALCGPCQVAAETGFAVLA